MQFHLFRTLALLGKCNILFTVPYLLLCVCYVLNSAVDVWFNVCVVDYTSKCLYCTTHCLSGTFTFSKSKRPSVWPGGDYEPPEGSIPSSQEVWSCVVNTGSIQSLECSTGFEIKGFGTIPGQTFRDHALLLTHFNEIYIYIYDSHK